MIMSDAPAIEAADVYRTYGEGDRVVNALRGARLTVQPGELVALSGPSGSGKTTMLNCLAGLDSPTAGRVVVLGQDLAELSYEDGVEWRRQNMSIVFQSTGLLPHLTAAENVDIVLRIRGVERGARKERVERSLADLGLADLANHRPDELSGGQQQRVSLARAIASRPRILIADEPTGQLDSETTSLVISQLHKLARAHDITLLMATHDRAVEDMADRVVAMVDGTISEGDEVPGDR